MNFDGMILTFHVWSSVVHCVHQDKCLKSEDSSLQVWIKHDFNQFLLQSPK